MNTDQARKHYEELRNNVVPFSSLHTIYSEILECLRPGTTVAMAKEMLREKWRREPNQGARMDFRIAAQHLEKGEK